MITREELLPKLKVGMKFSTGKNKFHQHDEGILTISKIEGFTLFLKKENGAEIIEGLAKCFGYDFDGKNLLTYHNDRTEGWIVVENKVVYIEPVKKKKLKVGKNG
jgi:hypothetical protein